MRRFLGDSVTAERDGMRIVLELPVRDQGTDELGDDIAHMEIPQSRLSTRSGSAAENYQTGRGSKLSR